MTHRVATATLAVILWVAADAGAAQESGRTRPARPPAPAAGQAQTGSDQPAHETHQQLQMIFQQYPPMLRQVLRLDPTLMTNEAYLGMYPALAAFLAQHPEVPHNPGFFLGGYGGFEPENFSDRSRAIAVVQDVLIGGLFLVGFGFFASLMAWGVKNLIDHRRWLRVSKMQSDVHSKLLDRLTSNEDLLAYIQSPAGRQFLEGASVGSGPTPPAISAPINRILWSAQVGVIFTLVGAGLWYSRTLTISEVGQPLSVLGVLSMFLGAGFALSAVVSYGLSKALGLFDSPAMRRHA